MKKIKQPLAIIGIGVRLPGEINSCEDLWNALISAKNCITPVPKDRWNIDKYYDPDPNKVGKIVSKNGGFINNVKKFDANFFDIFPNIAKVIDPRQRHILEVVYESFEDAGLTIDKVNNSNTSVTIGVFLGDESKKTSGSDLSQITAHTAMGVADTSVSAQISYRFNLKGPTLSLDTACSSSLVATHIACNSIWTGDAEMAIAGGVNLMTSHEHNLKLSKGGFLSPDGYCKSFDSSANGYVRGEGAGVILIKTLKDAERDNNHIYAVIRNTVVNSDGHTAEGITVPNEFAQIEMLQKSYRDIDIPTQDVDFIEAHGTGTIIGDPKETFAFGNVFSENRSKSDPLVIGSIKSNIGHTEAVSGIAGLIKLVLCIKNKKIPANLHFKNPNPEIKFEEWKLKVPTELISWPSDNHKKAIGGVNSFGAGGTNAHAVVEEYQSYKRLNDKIENIHDFPYIFILSAKSKKSLNNLVKKYIDFIRNSEDDLEEICYSLLKHRSLFKEKLIIISKSKQNVISALNAYLNDEKYERLIDTNSVNLIKKPKIAFVCSGQGPQWYGMGQQLMKKSKIFYNVIKKIDQIFTNLSGYSLLKEMNKTSSDSNIDQTKIAQPSIMAIQIALIEMWKSFGVNPNGIIGHSIGEVAAAYGAGSITLEEATRVIYYRSKEQDRASGLGKMLATNFSHQEASDVIKNFSSNVAIAAVNGPKMTVLSGDEQQLSKISELLAKKEIFSKLLEINVPFHSHYMEVIKGNMMRELSNLSYSESNIPLYSTVTGKKEDGLHLTNEYWYKNARDTVLFSDGIQQMINDGFNYFIEISPHPILSGGINDMLIENKKDGNCSVISSMSRKMEQFESNINYENIDFLTSLAKSYISGINVKFDSLFTMNNTDYFTKLPKYVWDHDVDYWSESKEHEEARLGKLQHPFIKNYVKYLHNNLGMWELNLNKSSENYLSDHEIDDSIVFPGAAQIEIAYEVGKQHYGDKFSYLENINFPLALFLPQDDSIPEARLEITSPLGDYKISSRNKNHDNWNNNGFGKIAFEDFKPNNNSLNFIKNKLLKSENKISVKKFYEDIKSYGLNYGKYFRLVKEMWQKNDEILAIINPHNDNINEINRYNLMPSISDACLHIILKRPENRLYLPHSIEKFKIYDDANIGDFIWSYAKIKEYNNDFLVGDIIAFNEMGSKLMEAQNIKLKYLKNSSNNLADDVYEGIYEYEWIKQNNIDESFKDTLEKKYILLFADKIISHDLIENLNKNYKIIRVNADYTYKQNNNIYSINPFFKDDFQKLFLSILGNNIKIDKIVNLWPVDVNFDESYKESKFLDKSKTMIEPSLNLIQSIIKYDINSIVYFITYRANFGKAINPLQGIIYGMSRVFVNEYPNYNLRVIDITDNNNRDLLENLYKEIATDDKNIINQTEILLNKEGRFARKLLSVTNEKYEEKSQTEVKSNYKSFKLEFDQNHEPIFKASILKQLNNNEVEIDVKYSSLNDGKFNQLSGVVKNTGIRVKDFKKGDEIVAITKNKVTGRTILKSCEVIKKPKNLSLNQLSNALIPYSVGYFSLHNIAKISANNFVLINNYDCDLAIAISNLAKINNAKIIALVNEQKNFILAKENNVDFILNKKGNFLEELKYITNNKGINTAITIPNNQENDIDRIMDEVMSPFSTSIIITNNSQKEYYSINSSRTESNISKFVLKTNDLFANKYGEISNLLKLVVSLLENHNLKNNTKLFTINDIKSALQYNRNNNLNNSSSIKIEGKIKLLSNDQIEFSNRGTYLITGGASGLGLTIAKWMSEKGAKSFILVSRSGPKYDSDIEIIDKMQNRGITIEINNGIADITKTSDLEKVVNFVNDNMLPLKGIIHSAGTLDDSTYPNMSIDKFMKVYNPKALGAWNLHQITKDLKLDLFLMISSVSSMIGIAGQNNYSAANNFLNHLAMYRKSIGLTAHSACFGLLSGEYAGMSRVDPEVAKMVYRIVGTVSMEKNDLERKLEHLILSNSSYSMLSPMNWENFIASYSSSKKRFLFKETLNHNLRNKKDIINDNLVLIKSTNDVEKIVHILQNALSNIIGISSKNIDIQQPITSIGLDSLMLNQFRNWIQSNMEINMTLMQIAKGPNLKEIANNILELKSNKEIPQNLNKEIVKRSTKYVNKLAIDKINNNSKELQFDFINYEAKDTIDVSGIENDTDLDILSDKWIIRKKTNKRFLRRIFCLHPVGAGASIFSYFLFNPPIDTEVFLIQVPGRENRLNERNYENMDKLISDIAKIVSSYIESETIFWGHSWGGITLFEVIRYLRKTNNYKYNSIKQLIVTGAIAPQLINPWKNRDSIKETAKESSGIEKIMSTISYIDDKSFLRRIIPVMKKDMKLITQYKYELGDKLDIPILAFGAIEDEVVLIKEIEHWKHQTTNNFTLRELHGDHWFLSRNKEFIKKEIENSFSY